MSLGKVVSSFVESYFTDVLFKQIVVINKQNVPTEGPLIIYGNHNNQFVDGMLLGRETPRNISFISAAKSMRRPLIGPLIKMTGAIPLERAMDLAKPGPGVLVSVQGTTVRGQGTQFTKIEVGASLDIFGEEYRIKNIISDTELVIDRPRVAEEGSEPPKPVANSPYKVIPKLDYNQLYESVWNHLKNQGCIGIFPEGGSHDRLDLLPLKAGICIMALGAMEKYGIPVTLVACGFNYYNPQNFRSKVILEYGDPYTIPKELVDLYRTNKRQAIATLLKTVESVPNFQNLREVTTIVKTFDNLSTLFTCRELYQVKVQKELNWKEKVDLNRRFAKGFDTLIAQKDKHPQVAKLYEQVRKFDQLSRTNMLPIKHMPKKNGVIFDFFAFLWYLGKTAIRMTLLVPSIFLIGPTATIISHLSERQRIKCLKNSKVKIRGDDVVGSYKVMLTLSIFPITSILNSVGLYYLLQRFSGLDQKQCKLIAAANYVLFPFYSLVMLKAYDSLVRTFRRLKFYFLRLLNRNSYDDYNRKRKELAEKIREAVDTYGGVVFPDFDQTRIIKKNQFETLYSEMDVGGHPSDTQLQEQQ